MDPELLRKSKKSKHHHHHHHHKRPPKPMSEDETSGGDLLVIATEEVASPSTSTKTKSPVTAARPPGTPTSSTSTNNNSSSNNKKRKKRDSASSDEERWLTAIESGKLDDVDDELKKIKPKDPALMTARQRAMYDRGVEGSPAFTIPTLMSLPTGYKEKVMTAEAIQKAAIKSQKRKQLADEKREKDKKKTMERLLKKQESKCGKSNKCKIAKMNVPVIMYRQSAEGATVTFPPGMELLLGGKQNKAYPKPAMCLMGCGNPKKYSCSQTMAPLCSLECYKKNIASRIL